MQSHLYSLVFGHIGKLSMIALYFILQYLILTQWLHGQQVNIIISGLHLDFYLWNIKYTWDHLLSSDIAHGGLVQVLSSAQWDDIRQVVRPFIEGLMALLLYQQIGFNSMKYEEETKRSVLDAIDRFLMRVPLIPLRHKRVTMAQQVALPFVVLLVGMLIATPMFLWVLPFFHAALHAAWLEPQLSAHPSLAEKLYTDGYDAFIIGFVAGFVVKRITRPVLNANMIFFCRRWIGKGRTLHWWMPPGMRDTIRSIETHENAAEHNKEQLALQNREFGPFVIVSAIVILILAVYGFYVIEYLTS